MIPHMLIFSAFIDLKFFMIDNYFKYIIRVCQNHVFLEIKQSIVNNLLFSISPEVPHALGRPPVAVLDGGGGVGTPTHCSTL